MRARIAICHPRLGRGGSEARVLWLLQALREQYELTLLTLGPVDLPALNEYYGTELKAGDFTVSRPLAGPWLARRRGGDSLRAALLRRHARARAGDFELLISAYNPIDFGRAGLQFIADFSFLPETRQRLHGQTSPLDGEGVLRAMGRRAYALMVRLAGGQPPGEDALRGDDLVIANSKFAAGVLEEHMGRACDAVLYPPVKGPRGGMAAAERAPTFVSVGRISIEKRIEEQIEILSEVRARGHDVQFRIFGGPLEGDYAEHIRRLVDAKDGWVTWEGWIRGEAKWNLLRNTRFGLHACQGEAFGISVAEMAQAGCIVFVPMLGGPAEIVGDERLTYGSVEQAVGQITELLSDVSGQQEISSALQDRAARFSAESFCGRVRSLVAEALART